MLTERLMPGTQMRPEVSAAKEAALSQKTDSTGGASFSDTLKGALDGVNQALSSADAASRDFAAGKAGNLHDLMISMEKADVSLRTLTEVRGKVVDAYQEIMRMQI